MLIKKLRSILVWYFAVFFCLLTAGNSSEKTVKTINDLLLLPSIPSSKAASSLMIGVTRAGTRLVAVGERGHIIISDDNGATWAQGFSPTSVTLTAVCFPSNDQGWAVGHDGVVLHTADGGKTWDKQLDGSQVNGLVLTQVKQILEAKKAAGRVEDATIIESLEFFLNDAEAAMIEGPARPFMDVWFRNEKEGLVVGAFGMILRTEDGGISWNAILDRIDNSDGYHYYSIGQAGSTLILAGEAGMLFSSEDFGASWKRLAPPYAGSYFAVAGSQDGTTLVAVGLRGTVIRSGDGGKSWELAASPPTSSLAGAAVFSDGSFWFVASDGDVLRIRDWEKPYELLPFRVEGAADVAEAVDGSAVVVGMNGVTRICRDQFGKGEQK
jgi:photosystem II stability/assembly factor-like uncharacterized protein